MTPGPLKMACSPFLHVSHLCVKFKMLRVCFWSRMRFRARRIYDILYIRFETRCIYSTYVSGGGGGGGGRCIYNVFDLRDAFTCTMYTFQSPLFVCLI